MSRLNSSSTLFPYTTLFRSSSSRDVIGPTPLFSKSTRCEAGTLLSFAGASVDSEEDEVELAVSASLPPQLSIIKGRKNSSVLLSVFMIFYFIKGCVIQYYKDRKSVV